MSEAKAAPPKALMEEFKKQLVDAKKTIITILLIGRTGVGKSSTINRLIGEDVAPVGDFEPKTQSVEFYNAKINGIKYKIWDTPGLCDDLPHKGHDKEHITEMRSKVKRVDLVLYVTKLSDNRVTADEKRAVKLVTKSFGRRVWNHTLVTFTFSRSIPTHEFGRYRKNRSRLILREIRTYAPNTDLDIQHCVCTDNDKDLEGKNVGLPELWTQTFLRIEKSAFAPFMFSQIQRAKANIALTKRQEHLIDDRIRRDTPSIYGIVKTVFKYVIKGITILLGWL